MKNLLVLALGLSILSAAVAACSGSGSSSSAGSGGSGGSGAPDAGADAPPSLQLTVEPPSITATVQLDGTANPIAFHAYADTGGGSPQNVTGMVSWDVVQPAIASIDNLGTATLQGIGGKTLVRATYQGTSATSSLTVTLEGDAFLDGADPAVKMGFDTAMPDPNPGNAPVVEYPEDGVVLPSNLPPIEVQWAPGGDSNIFRVRLSSPDVLQIELYTPLHELLFPSDIWTKIRASAPDAPITLSIDGLGPTQLLRTGPSRSLIVASDGIDESAIYVWQSSTGSFRVLDIIQGTDIPLPNDSPALAPGQPCSGCHRISRDGKRFAYSYNGAQFQIGTLTYDPAQQTFVSKIAPVAGVRGTYAAFNPLESTTIPAMLLTVPDDVAQNTAGTVRLEFVDPETNAPIASNASDMLANLDPAVGHAALMPDWSPGGDFVVFTAYDSAANYVRELGDDVVLGSIIEAPVSYSAQNGFQFGAPKVLVAAPAGGNPDTGENNLLPAISPDGAAVAFTRANGWWSIKTQQSLLNLSGRIAIVRRSDGMVFELAGAPNGPAADWSSTWPQWAPTPGSKYAWLAYASERPYGHRLTAANSTCSLVQGQKQCKQLWITAIDLGKLASGTEDPSLPPFWIPGQSIQAQYVSPQWTKAVLPPPK